MPKKTIKQLREHIRAIKTQNKLTPPRAEGGGLVHGWIGLRSLPILDPPASGRRGGRPSQIPRSDLLENPRMRLEAC